MKKEIFYGTISQFVMTLVSMAGNIAFFALIVRHLSPFDAGIWFTFMGVNVLLSFFDFGLPSVLSNEIALASYKKCLKIRVDNLYSNVTKVLYLFLIFALGLGFIFYLVMLKQYEPVNPSLQPAYWIFLVGFCLRLVANAPLGVIYGLGKVALQANMITASTLLGFIFSALFLVYSPGLVELAFAATFSHFFLYLLSFLYVRFYLKYRIRFKLHGRVLKRIGKISFQWTLMTLGAILVLQIPGFVIVKLMGPEALPPFAIMRQMGTSILSFSIIIGNAARPFISQSVGQDDTAGTNRLFQYVVKYSTGIALSMAIYVFAMNHEIARIWLGNAFMFDQTMLLMLLAGIVLESHHVAIAKVCLSAGHVRFATISLVAGLLVTLLSLFFIHLFGVGGAAIAIVVSQLLSNNWFAVWVAFNYLKVDRRLYLRLLQELAMSGVILASVIAGMKYCFPSDLGLEGSFKALLGDGVVYGVCVLGIVFAMVKRKV